MIRCHQCRFWNRSQIENDGFALCNLLSNEADTISDLAKAAGAFFVTTARFGCVDGEPDLEQLLPKDVAAWLDDFVETKVDEHGQTMFRLRKPSMTQE